MLDWANYGLTSIKDNSGQTNGKPRVFSKLIGGIWMCQLFGLFAKFGVIYAFMEF